MVEKDRGDGVLLGQLDQWQCCISGSMTYVQHNMPAKPLKTMMSSDMDEDLRSFHEPIAPYAEPAGDAGTRCASRQK